MKKNLRNNLDSVALCGGVACSVAALTCAFLGNNTLTLLFAVLLAACFVLLSRCSK